MTDTTTPFPDRRSEELKAPLPECSRKEAKAWPPAIARYLETDAQVDSEGREAVANDFFHAGVRAKGLGRVAEAATLLERAVSLGCREDEAVTGLAYALLHCNRLEEAHAVLDRAPETLAGESTALWLRGQIELKRQRFPSAEEWLRRAIAQGPVRAEMLVDLSFALDENKKFVESAEAVARALSMNPSLYDSYLEVGDQALAIDQEALALWWLRRAEKVTPSTPAAWHYLGTRYYVLGARDDAERAQLASLQCAPSLNAYHSLSRLLEQSNRIKQASNVARTGLRLDPANSALRNVMARCLARQGAKEQAIAILREIGEGSGDLDTKASALIFAGKILDGQNRFDEAFEAFSLGKKLRAALPDYDTFNLESASRQLRECKALVADELRPVASEERTVGEPDVLVFFVGFPRSGTTLLQEVMHAHPDIVVAEERSMASITRSLLLKLSHDVRAGLAHLTPAKAQMLRRAYFLQASAYKPWIGKKVFVDKMPLNLILLPLLRLIFPEAKIVLGLRHPCSAVLSCFMQDFHLNNAMVHMLSLDSISAYYNEVMDLWLVLTRDPTFTPLVVKYEDVVKDLESQAKRLTEFFGVPFSPEMLGYAEKAKTRSMIRTPSYSQVVRPIYTEAVERWRHYASHLAPFQERLSPYIKAFGYKD